MKYQQLFGLRDHHSAAETETLLPPAALWHSKLPARRWYGRGALWKAGMLCSCQRSSSPKPVGHRPCWLGFQLPVRLLPAELACGQGGTAVQPPPCSPSRCWDSTPVQFSSISLYFIYHVNTYSVSIFPLMLPRKLNHSKTHCFIV